MRIVRAALVYFGIAFAAGFALGVVRGVFLEPRLGPFTAVLAETPVMLAICWIAAGWTMRRWLPGATPGAAAATGALWLVLLLGAEAAVGLGLRRLSLADTLAAFFTPPGLAGLAAQVVCAIFPLLRRSAGAQMPWRR
jgi:hypothetical protein